MEKYCSKCSSLKDALEFNKRADGPGLRSHCRKCSSKANYAKRYALANRRPPTPSKETLRLRSKEYLKKYRSSDKYKTKHAADMAKRRASKQNATPSWLNAKQLDHINFIYASARFFTKLFGVQMDVDHIIPLKGKIVSGLHVPWNLQLMVHSANMDKSNKVTDEY